MAFDTSALLAIAAIDTGRTDGSSVNFVRPSTIEDLILMGRSALATVIERLEGMDYQAQKHLAQRYGMGHTDAMNELERLWRLAENSPCMPLDRRRTHFGTKTGNTATALINGAWREVRVTGFALEQPDGQQAWMVRVTCEATGSTVHSIANGSSQIATLREFKQLQEASPEFRRIWASASRIGSELADQIAASFVA